MARASWRVCCLALLQQAAATPPPTPMLSALVADAAPQCVDVGKDSTGAERECFHHVNWAKYRGILQDPGFYANYSSLSNYSSFADFQCALWHMRSIVSDEAGSGHGCPKPCASTLVQCTGQAPAPSPAEPPVCADVGMTSQGLEHECFHFAKKAKYMGIVQHPERYTDYDGLSTDSDLVDFQCALWHMKAPEAHCPKPCTSKLTQCACHTTVTKVPLWAILIIIIALFGVCTSAIAYYCLFCKPEDDAYPKKKKRSAQASMQDAKEETRSLNLEVEDTEVPPPTRAPIVGQATSNYTVITPVVPVSRRVVSSPYPYFPAPSVQASPVGFTAAPSVVATTVRTTAAPAKGPQHQGVHMSLVGRDHHSDLVRSASEAGAH